MQISLWMIANQLENYDVELNINEPSTVRYKSVRTKPKKDCVLLKEDGQDILLVGTGENNFIRLKNFNKEEAFELIQDIFDLYADWDEMLNKSMVNFNYKKIIDESWKIFHCPIFLLDSNSKLLAMSSQVDPNLNPEWKHLYEYGYQSVSNYNRFRHILRKQELDPNPRPLYVKNPPTTDRASFLSALVRYNNILYGRFILMEYGRKVTEGDFQNAQHLCNVIAKNMFKLDREDHKASTYSNILKMINGETVSQEAINQFLSYMNWKAEDKYRIAVVMLKEESMDPSKSTMLLIQEYLRSYLPLCPSYIINDYIVLLFNENKVLYKKSIDGIKTTYLSKINVLFGASLQFTGLKNLRTYVKQAIYAIKKGQKRKPEAKFFIFYRYALDYVLESNSIEEKLCACHPDVIELWKKEKESESYELQTLKEYLRCERSLLKASENLFIHRNTLLYRINKIIDNLNYSLDNPYTREYILTSIRILELFCNNQLNCEDLL